MLTTNLRTRRRTRAFIAPLVFLAGQARGDFDLDLPDAPPVIDPGLSPETILQTADLPSVKDTYGITQFTFLTSTRSSGDGTAPQMFVSYLTSGPTYATSRHSMVQFDIAGGLPGSAVIYGAKLRLYQDNTATTAGSPSCSIGLNLGPWDETPTSPTPDAMAVGSADPGAQAGWKEFDVTEAVRWLAEDPSRDHGFRISTGGPFNRRSFLTREAHANRPHLRISYYHPPTPPAAERFRRGDADLNRELTLVDAIRVLNYLFLRSQDLSCLDAADSNDDGLVNISDPVHLLAFLFQGGSRPPAPSPGCGVDATGDQLSCESYDACWIIPIPDHIPLPLDP